MKKFFKAFMSMDLPWKVILIGTPIAGLGYVMGGPGPTEFWDPVMWIGSGIAAIGWVMMAFWK